MRWGMGKIYLARDCFFFYFGWWIGSYEYRNPKTGDVF